jgi:hypothetical protein
MKFKKDAPVFYDSDGFWYSLTIGGYLKPSVYIESPATLSKVEKAIKTICAFERELKTTGLYGET